MHADGGSNVILVTSPSLLHNVIKTTNKICNTGGSTASISHTGELHMLLDTPNKKILMSMKQAYVMPSNNHNTLGLSLFLLNGCHRVSHAMNECVAIKNSDKDQANMPITLIRNSLDYISIKIVAPPSTAVCARYTHTKYELQLHVTYRSETTNAMIP